jgi:hypothetical protein
VTPGGGSGILGRRGLLIGVFALLAIALLGGRSLLHRHSAARSGIARVLDAYPGFPAVTPARATIGSTGDARAAAGAVAAQASSDWQRQFAATGRVWQDPSWPLPVAGVADPARRAAIVLSVGIAAGGRVEQLTGIDALAGLQARQRRLAPQAAAAAERNLATCLAGAWGRSVIAPSALEAVATPEQAVWVARGARHGLPGNCIGAVTP